MGQRANLIIVEQGRHRLYYNHWCANRLDCDLFWGPDHAAEFIRLQDEVGDDKWLDDIWAEGGAVLDRDRSVLFLFGGKDVLADVPLRRLYLELVGRVWKGWRVQWAYSGIVDLADYVGYPRERVMAEVRDDRRPTSLAPPEKPAWTDIVGSFRLEDGRLRLCPLAGEADGYLQCGPQLIEWCRWENAHADLDLAAATETFPSGGFHVDVLSRSVGFWLARQATDIERRLAQYWPGWNVAWHRDSYEQQLEQTCGLLHFPERSRDRLLDEIRRLLLRENSHKPIGSLGQTVDMLRNEGKSVQVNPWTQSDYHLELPLEVRRRILDAALSENEVH
jgi:hypothetical protein